MYYRTRTYVAEDWDGDKEAIELLQKWNEGDQWLLSFSDAHKLMQARDDSLNCSIKNHCYIMRAEKNMMKGDALVWENYH